MLESASEKKFQNVNIYSSALKAIIKCAGILIEMLSHFSFKGACDDKTK